MLKKIFIRFLIVILILSIILVLIEQVFLFLNLDLISIAYPWLVLLFLVVSSTFHYFILKSAQEDARKFINVFLLATTLKLLLYFSSILAVLFMFKINAKIFILNFASLYLIYTITEVYLALTQLKKLSSLKRNNSSNKLSDTPLNEVEDNTKK